jgi:hypothetical protein
MSSSLNCRRKDLPMGGAEARTGEIAGIPVERSFISWKVVKRREGRGTGEESGSAALLEQ